MNEWKTTLWRALIADEAGGSAPERRSGHQPDILLY